MNHSSNRVIMFSLYYVCVSVCLCENGAFGSYTFPTLGQVPEVGIIRKRPPKLSCPPLPNEHPSIFFFFKTSTYLPTYPVAKMYSLSTILTLLAATAPIMVHAQAQHCPAHTQAVGAAIVEGAPISSATCDTKALSCSNKAPPRAVRQPGTRDQPCIYIVRFFFFLFSSPHVVSEKRIVLGVVRLFADFFFFSFF